LSPRPITGHEIPISALPIFIPHFLGCEIDLICEVCVLELIFQNDLRIPVPNLICGMLPRCSITLHNFSIKRNAKRVPRSITQLNRVNCLVEISFVDKRWVFIGWKGCGPDLKKLIDVASGHLILSEEEVSELKCCAVGERRVVVQWWVVPRRRRSPWGQKIAVCIARES
jgi:hypothetical protein